MQAIKISVARKQSAGRFFKTFFSFTSPPLAEFLPERMIFFMIGKQIFGSDVDGTPKNFFFLQFRIRSLTTGERGSKSQLEILLMVVGKERYLIFKTSMKNLINRFYLSYCMPIHTFVIHTITKSYVFNFWYL